MNFQLFPVAKTADLPRIQLFTCRFVCYIWFLGWEKKWRFECGHAKKPKNTQRDVMLNFFFTIFLPLVVSKCGRRNRIWNVVLQPNYHRAAVKRHKNIFIDKPAHPKPTWFHRGTPPISISNLFEKVQGSGYQNVDIVYTPGSSRFVNAARSTVKFSVRYM